MHYVGGIGGVDVGREKFHVHVSGRKKNSKTRKIF